MKVWNSQRVPPYLTKGVDNMAIYKRCSNCHQLYTGSRCPACKKKQDHAYYKKKVERDKLVRIYHTRLWEKCRKNIIIKYLGYDIWLLAEGKVVKPDRLIIHHIVERQEAPELMYDIDNLITVSPESHNQIHIYYNTNKAYALERIERGKQKFIELFGDK